MSFVKCLTVDVQVVTEYVESVYKPQHVYRENLETDKIWLLSSSLSSSLLLYFLPNLDKSRHFITMMQYPGNLKLQCRPTPSIFFFFAFLQCIIDEPCVNIFANSKNSKQISLDACLLSFY